MKKYEKLLIAAGAFTAVTATGAAVASRRISKYVVDTALDREHPRKIRADKRNSDVISREIREEIQVLSEKLLDAGCERIEITAPDGEKLVGHWHHKAGDKRVIIAMHGWRSNWAHDFSAISQFWHENGCSVLYAEQRGQGESGGAYMGFGMIERFDCMAWIDWVNSEHKNIPLYLAGISMGASTVLMAGGFNLPENVCGIIADCAFTSAKAIWKHVVEENTHFSYDVRSKAVEQWCKKKINLTPEEYSTIDAMENCKVPVLFIHGTDDNFVPINMTYENYKACKSEKRLFIVVGATHAMSYIVDKEGYEKAVMKFWKKYDGLIAEKQEE